MTNGDGEPSNGEGETKKKTQLVLALNFVALFSPFSL